MTGFETTPRHRRSTFDAAGRMRFHIQNTRFFYDFQAGRKGSSVFWENYTMRKCIGLGTTAILLPVKGLSGKAPATRIADGIRLKAARLPKDSALHGVRRIANLFHSPRTSPRTTMFPILYAVHYKD